MPKLHELTAALNHVDDLIDNTEMTDEQIITYVDAIEGELKIKVENIAKLLENLDATADNMKAAEAKMATRRKAIENRSKAIRNYLLTNMVNSSIFEIKCEYFKIAVRDNPPAVIIDDPKLLPVEYLRYPDPPPPSPDKKKILEDVTKHGVVLEGVRIERGQRIDIR